MDDLANYLPPLLTGAELIEALTRLPEYNVDIRLMPASERLMRLTDIYRVFLPTTMCVDIYHKLYMMTRMSLDQKGNSDSVRRLNATYNLMHGLEYHGVITGGTCATVIGSSGIGKTSCVQYSIELLGGVIDKQESCHKIVPVLQISCPYDSSCKGLLFQIIIAIDEALGSNYYDTVCKSRVNSQQLLGVVSQICHLHVGTLVVDEIQNIIEHRAGRQLYMMLIQLINTTGISLLLVGTPECTAFFQQVPQMARRTVGLNYGPMTYGDDFSRLCSTIYSYQYVYKASAFNESICNWLFMHSGGLPSSLVALVYFAQEVAILRGIESLGLESLTIAYNERMRMLHRHTLPSIHSKLPQTTKLKREFLPIPKEASLHVAVTRTMADVVTAYKRTGGDLIAGLRSMFSVEEIDDSVHAEDLPR